VEVLLQIGLWWPNGFSPVTGHQLPFSVLAIQFQEVDGRGFLKLDAEVAGDLAQGVIEVGEMIDGHVSHEGAANFIIAGAAVQPAKKEKHLEARREADHDPVGIHRGLGESDFLVESESALFACERGRNPCGISALSRQRIKPQLF
jgi:hypothetical protein